jgi:hypothetical protein
MAHAEGNPQAGNVYQALARIQKRDRIISALVLPMKSVQQAFREKGIEPPTWGEIAQAIEEKAAKLEGYFRLSFAGQQLEPMSHELCAMVVAQLRSWP